MRRHELVLTLYTEVHVWQSVTVTTESRKYVCIYTTNQPNTKSNPNPNPILLNSMQ